MNETTGTAHSRERIFIEAGGTFVLCMDCHVLIVPGALRRLLAYIDAHPNTSDLLQGPMIFDDFTKIATHFEQEWRAGMYGRWATNPAGLDPTAEPFEIVSQGLGLFVCRQAAWPGFNPAFRGFGGEEGYLHEKFRRRGDRTLCLPFLRWLHRFPRPSGIPYPNRWDDRVRNYVIGFRELGLPLDDAQEHFRKLIGAQQADEYFAKAILELERAELDLPDVAE